MTPRLLAPWDSDGRGRTSSGLSRSGPPGRTRRGTHPQASASGPYSPFGSTTHACRPNTCSRQRKVLTKVDFPLPICPITSMLGLVSCPRRYSSQGSKQNDPPKSSRPISTPLSPKPSSAMNGYSACACAVVAR